MDRYSHGFGGFGPMEQSANGKWVKYEDHISNIHEIENIYDVYIDEIHGQSVEAYLRELDWKMIAFLTSLLLVMDIVFSIVEAIIK